MTEYVLPQHANALGTVFGGQIMAWVDLCAAICSQRHSGKVTVTAFVDDVKFQEPVKIGEVVRLKARVTATFRTSMEIEVVVQGEDPRTQRVWPCVDALLVFVAIDARVESRSSFRCSTRRPKKRARRKRPAKREEQRGSQRASPARIVLFPTVLRGSTMDTKISDLAKHVGETVTLRGWLYNKRSSKKVHFLEVRDGSGIVQAIVFVGNVTADEFALADRVQQETSLVVTGVVKAHDKRPGRVRARREKYFGDGRDHVREYPISPKDHGTDFLMDNRHLWLRSKRQHAIMRVRHTIIKAVRDFFDNRDFTLVDAPIFTPNACEGTSTLFQTDYHGDPAYLTQSGQLYMEAAAAAFGSVYCFGPTFRAEKSKTRRHLAEFWMVEPEVAFMDLDGDMKLGEELLEYVVGRALEDRKEELKVVRTRHNAFGAGESAISAHHVRRRNFAPPKKRSPRSKIWR